MSVGIVDKQTGDRIPTAGMPAIDNALDLTSVNPVQNAVITAALANKQDKTDNALQTTDKTVVGGINELKSGLTNLDDEVNGDATTYPYADVITIEDAVPSNLAQCSVKIEPVQSGSGDPSPTNIRPIIGHTDVSVQRDGKNLFDKNNAGNLNGYALNSEIGVPYATASGWTTSSFIEIEPSTTYTLTTMSVNNSVAFYDGEKVYISGATSFGTKTTPSNAKYLRFDYKTENAGIMQLELGSAETPYVPYVEPKTYTITLGSTIYGGTLDVDSGVLTVDRVSVDMGTLPWGADGQNMFRANITGAKTYSRNILPPWKCEVYPTKAQDDTSGQCISSTNWTSAVCLWNSGYSDAASVATALSGKLLVYELATPTTIQLTPQQIQLLKGTNTLTASTGQISVTVNGVSGSIGSVQEQVNGLTRAIGWDDARNIFNGIIRQGYVSNTTGEYVDSATRWVCTTKQECKENTTYTISASSSFLTRKIIVIYFDSNDTIISFSDFDHEASPVNINATITTPNNTAYIIVDIANQRNDDGYNITPSDVWNVQIEEGTQATSYIPYHPVIGTAVEELLDKVPDAPTTDGTYILTVTVASGTPTYSWVSGS